jgi:effector-binding domain-containing protein
LKFVVLAFVGVGGLFGLNAMAYEAAYPMTAAGVCEIKTLPAGVLLEARSEGEYFRENNGLFRRLFAAIQKNQIPMTTPVEAGVRPGTMVFYLDPKSAKRADLVLQGGVRRREVEARVVASIGIRGGYSKESFEENARKIREWIDTQLGWKPAGDPYVVYWNSPFMIWFLKRSEVHLPIRKG